MEPLRICGSFPELPGEVIKWDETSVTRITAEKTTDLQIYNRFFTHTKMHAHLSLLVNL